MMLSLRLVLDTNVIVSAALNPEGLQHAVLLLAATKPARLYVSTPILQEYTGVLARPELGIRRGLQLQVLQLIKNRSYPTVPLRRLSVTVDPDDNMFLECADAARADYLITGNLRHFPKFWKNTKVITASEFLTMVAPHLLG